MDNYAPIFKLVKKSLTLLHLTNTEICIPSTLYGVYGY